MSEAMESPVMIAAMFMECDGGCKSVVRIDARLCDACRELECLFEGRRLDVDARNRRYGVGQYARLNAGVVDLPEMPYLPTMLADAPRRKLFQGLALAVAASLILWACSWMFVQGCVGLFHRFVG